MNFNGKRLYKKRNSTLCGVCAGVADYLEVDPTLIRLAWVIFGCMGVGLFAYFVAALIMPFEDTTT